MKTRYYLVIMLSMFILDIDASLIIAIKNKGKWHNGKTWDLKRIPIASDTVIIPDGIEVYADECINFKNTKEGRGELFVTGKIVLMDKSAIIIDNEDQISIEEESLITVYNPLTKIPVIKNQQNIMMVSSKIPIKSIRKVAENKTTSIKIDTIYKNEEKLNLFYDLINVDSSVINHISVSIKNKENEWQLIDQIFLSNKTDLKYNVELSEKYLRQEGLISFNLYDSRGVKIKNKTFKIELKVDRKNQLNKFLILIPKALILGSVGIISKMIIYFIK